MSNAMDGGSIGFELIEKISISDVDTTPTLDLILPRRSQQPLPCIMVIPGGGFRAQDGQKFRPFAEYFVQHGFAAALIGYRGSPEHRYPDTMRDILAAWRYLRTHGEAYGIDVNRIGAMGRSAGASLVALLAASKNMAWLSSIDSSVADDPPGARLKAAVCIAGVYDMVARFESEEQMQTMADCEQRLASGLNWIGKPFAAEDEDWKNVSAINFVDSEFPPTLLMHSRDDLTVPWQQSRDFYERLKAADVQAELALYEAGGHGVFAVDEAERMHAMASFFTRQLK